MLTRGALEHPDLNSDYYEWQPDEDTSIIGHFHLYNGREHGWMGELKSETGFVSDLRIRGDRNHNQGYGTIMLAELVKEAYQRGMKRIRLTVLISNAIAIRVYEKTGFHIESTSYSMHTMLLAL